MPKRGEYVSVEVEEDGEIEWRKALVTRRLFATGEFLVAVCYPDGTVDTLFVESYRLEEEGCEWRRLARPEGPTAAAE